MAIFSHVNNIMLLKVFNSLGFSLMINAPIDLTFETFNYICTITRQERFNCNYVCWIAKSWNYAYYKHGFILEVWMEYIEINNSRNNQYYINDWQSPRIVNKVKEWCFTFDQCALHNTLQSSSYMWVIKM